MAISFQDPVQGELNSKQNNRESGAQQVESDDQDAVSSGFHLSQIRSRATTQRLTKLYFQITNVQVLKVYGLDMYG